MIVHIAILIIGFVLLIKGSDFFVSNSAQVAKKLGVSELIIGLTIVAIGTSLPELVSVIFSAINKSSELILGNIVGSNIANICLILGITALFGAIRTTPIMWERDGFIMLFVSVLFYIGIFGGTLYRTEGAFLLLLFFVYLLFLSSIKEKYKEKFKFRQFLNYFLRFRYISTIRSYHSQLIDFYNNRHKRKAVSTKKKKEFRAFKEGLIQDFLVIIISLVALIYGAHLVIQNSITLADMFGISQRLIGLTIVAIGTSLPELSVAISAVRKGLGNIVIGNVVGSNIANLLLVLGVATLINPIRIGLQTIHFIAPVMIGLTILLLITIRTGWRIKRYEGVILLVLYAAFFILGTKFGLI